MKYLFRNSELIDPETGRLNRKDLLISDDNDQNAVIIDSNIPISKCSDGTNIIDMKGNCLIPAFCDIRCSIGDIFDNTSRAKSEIMSAYNGGYGCICTLGRSSHSNNGHTYPDYVSNISRYSRVIPIIASSVIDSFVMGTLVDFDTLIGMGCRAFCEEPGTPTQLLFTAAEIIAKRGMLLIVQPCDHSLLYGGTVGKSAPALKNLARIPDIAESLAVDRAILISKETSCRIHIPCVSLASSVKAIENAKKDGVNITCSTAPQYFAYDSRDIILKGSKSKLLPPLRSEKDKDAVLGGIADGTIDCISSDNIPVPLMRTGEGAPGSEFGNSGFITAFPASYTYLVKQRVVSLARLVEMMSRKPLEILMNREYNESELISYLGVVCPDLRSDELFIETTVNHPHWTSIFDGSCLYGKIIKNYNGSEAALRKVNK